MTEPHMQSSRRPNRMLMSVRRASRSLSAKRKKNSDSALLTSKDTNMLGARTDDEEDPYYNESPYGMVIEDLDLVFKKKDPGRAARTRSPPKVVAAEEKVPRSLSPSRARAMGHGGVRRNKESLGDYWTRKEQEAQDNITNHRLYADLARASPPSDHENNGKWSDFDKVIKPSRSTSQEPRLFYGLEDPMDDILQRRDEPRKGRKNKGGSYRSKSPTAGRSTGSRSSRRSKNSASPNSRSKYDEKLSMGMHAAALARAAANGQQSGSDDDDSPFVSELEDEDSLKKIRHDMDNHKLLEKYSSNSRGSGRNTPQSFDSLSNKKSSIDLHKVLEHCAWATLYSHIKTLSDRRELVHSAFSSKQSGSTPLHTMVWKAPPFCTLEAIRALVKSKDTAILAMKDRDGNTPLHLFCANLEFHEQHEDDEDIDTIYLDILELMIKLTPRVLSMHNGEGDTPLHLFCASPAVCMKTEQEDKPLKEKRKIALKTLLQNFGHDSSFLTDKSGATPLHVAIAHAVDELIIMRLLRVGGSKVLHKEDDRGMIPLHYAAAFVHSSHTVVAKMIELYPESIYHRTHNKDTPMHLLVSNACQKTSQISISTAFNGKLDRNTVKVVELLLGKSARFSVYQYEDEDRDSSSSKKRCPLLMQNREKLTPLHCCALFDVSPQLTRLIMKHPLAKKAASVTNSFGATPLHLAAAQPGVATSVATVVAIGTHEAAGVQDRLKRTPLHVASQNIHATSILIKSLVQLYPEAVSEKTQRGHLPLHLAAQSQAKEPVMRALIKAYPKGAEAKNKSYNTPLHDAAKYRSSVEVVKVLLEAYPEAVYVQNQYGNLPLHCATAYQSPANVIAVLIQAWSDGAAMQNRNQDAPLHYAAAYATNISSLEALIAAAPAAVLLLNSSGQSPIDRAKANNAPDEIIEYLESSAKEWTLDAAKDGWGTFSNNDGSGFGMPGDDFHPR